jgi:hypothetical protein
MSLRKLVFTPSLSRSFFLSPRGSPSMAQLQRASPLAIHGAEASGRKKKPREINANNTPFAHDF